MKVIKDICSINVNGTKYPVFSVGTGAGALKVSQIILRRGCPVAFVGGCRSGEGLKALDALMDSVKFGLK
jgi:hypothetical protein